MWKIILKDFLWKLLFWKTDWVVEGQTINFTLVNKGFVFCDRYPKNREVIRKIIEKQCTPKQRKRFLVIGDPKDIKIEDLFFLGPRISVVAGSFFFDRNRKFHNVFFHLIPESVRNRRNYNVTAIVFTSQPAWRGTYPKEEGLFAFAPVFVPKTDVDAEMLIRAFLKFGNSRKFREFLEQIAG